MMRGWITHIATIVVVERPFQDGWFGALKFGARSLFQHDCDAVFSPHHSQLFVSWTRMPSPGELHTSALASSVLAAVRCTASIAHAHLLYWELHFFCSLQKDVYEELCGLFSVLYLPIGLFADFAFK
jgi:hypothetical protein